MNPIPQPFLNKMSKLLGPEFPAFEKELLGAPYKGLRINTLKVSVSQFLEKDSPFQLEPIPWIKEGFYYNTEDRPGKHPYHHAGLYYIQEPSAMAVAEILAPQPGEKVLDLAAAPGGKTTQCATLMNDQGLLVANEIHPTRAKILSENVERLGITCALVTNEEPQKLAKHFPQFFDRILVDAPCSGEGMFRKDEEARAEWSLDHVAFCARRQQDILAQAATMLKQGGKLVYSTCTFAPEENEQVIAEFLHHHPDWSLLPISERVGFSPGKPEWTKSEQESGLKEEPNHLQLGIRLWPHHLKGEGHYIALLQKGKESDQETTANQIKATKNRDKTLSQAIHLFQSFAEEYLNLQDDGFFLAQLHLFGQHLYRLPEKNEIELQGLKVLRPGLHLGEMKKNRFEPSHALAMSLKKENFKKVIQLSADQQETLAYLRGETLTVDLNLKGWVGVLVDNFPLGWGKASQGQLKNHYPKGLRML